jgi:hypothetical protein
LFFRFPFTFGSLFSEGKAKQPFLFPFPLPEGGRKAASPAGAPLPEGGRKGCFSPKELSRRKKGRPRFLPEGLLLRPLSRRGEGEPCRKEGSKARREEEKASSFLKAPALPSEGYEAYQRQRENSNQNQRENGAPPPGGEKPTKGLPKGVRSKKRGKTNEVFRNF